MDFVNSACAHAVVAKNQIKNKLVRDFRAAKAGELSGQGLIEYVLIIAVISLVVVFAGPPSQVPSATSSTRLPPL